jgi:RNA polymerase sigma-70 factor (ECF subfamily)
MNNTVQADFKFFFEKYGPAIYRRALYLLGNQQDAEDATQEVFLKAIKNIHVFEHRSRIYTWLIKIATNHCLNLLRNKKRQRELLNDHVAKFAQLDSANSAEEIIITRQLLANVEQKCAAAAVFVLVDGMTHKEAAKLLEVSPRNVGYLVERFIKNCREKE